MTYLPGVGVGIFFPPTLSGCERKGGSQTCPIRHHLSLGLVGGGGVGLQCYPLYWNGEKLFLLKTYLLLLSEFTRLNLWKPGTPRVWVLGGVSGSSLQGKGTAAHQLFLIPPSLTTLLYTTLSRTPGEQIFPQKALKWIKTGRYLH